MFIIPLSAQCAKLSNSNCHNLAHLDWLFIYIGYHVAVTLEQHKDTHIVLTFDIENGYSATSRSKVAELLNKTKSLEHLRGIFYAAYMDTNTVQFNLNNQNVLTKMIDGLVQGDPLAGLYFCLLFGEVLNKANTVSSEINQCLATMFLDDAQLTGTPEKVLEMLHILKPVVQQLGFKFAKGKTQAYAKSSQVFNQNSAASPNRSNPQQSNRSNP